MSDHIWDTLVSLLEPREDADWTASALCAQVGGNLWFPEKGEPAAPAKQLCNQCDVKAECLAYAMGRAERGFIDHGIWGGLSEQERRYLHATGELPNPSTKQMARADRYDMIRNLMHGGLSVREVVASTGVERRTVLRAIKGTELERKLAA